MGPESPGIDQPRLYLAWDAHLESNYPAIAASKSSPNMPRNPEAHYAVGVPDSHNTVPASGSASIATQTFVTHWMPTATAISHTGLGVLSENVSPSTLLGQHPVPA